MLHDPAVRAAWLEYGSQFPHQSAYFRAAPQYAHQSSVVNGKRTGTDINLYKLFIEQCNNLLRAGGQCGIVVPSGIYTDLGTKGLRELLFAHTRVTGLFGFENHRDEAARARPGSEPQPYEIFEGVHASFKFVVLTYTKGGDTASFPAAFMRHDPTELDRFPKEGAQSLSVGLIRRLSPDSLSLMEFKDATDVQIAEKMLRFPLLGEKRDDTWNLTLTNEFHMTNDSHLFRTEPGPGRLPLFTGKMFNQFLLTGEHSGYWLDEKAGRAALWGKRIDSGQPLDYQGYRWVHRRIARNTDSRTMISTITPKNVFTEVNSTTIKVQETGITDTQMLCLCAVMNSFSLDWVLRHKVNTTLNMFYIYQLPVPRLTERDAAFAPIVERAARLICTTPEYDALARAAGLRDHTDGVTDPAARAALRAELDGLVAHLYGLTDDEFAHILATFPLVAPPVKDAALAAYRALTPRAGDPAITALIAAGESGNIEFKESVRWDTTGQRRGEKVIVKTVAAFLNAAGGTLLIGVRDDGTVAGLEPEYATLREGKRTRDGFELFLMQLLANAFGKDRGAFYTASFHAVGGKTVCRVTVRPCTEEVWFEDEGKSHFYARVGNASQPLAGPELTRYVRTHWG